MTCDLFALCCDRLFKRKRRIPFICFEVIEVVAVIAE